MLFRSLVRDAAAEFGATLTDAMLDEIARLAITDARQLFGYVRRLVATQRFQLRVESGESFAPTEPASDGGEDPLRTYDPEKLCWDWPDLTHRLVEETD